MTAERHDCADALRGSRLYMDDALEPDARAAVEAHLAACPECSNTVAFQHTLRATVVRAVTSEPLPGDLVQRLLARLETEPGTDTAGA